MMTFYYLLKTVLTAFCICICSLVYSFNPSDSEICDAPNLTDTLLSSESLSTESSVNVAEYTTKKPGLAFLFSFLLPGGGQYYNGQYVKGLVMTGIAGLSITTICLLWSDEHGMGTWATAISISAVVYGANWLWSMVDAPIFAHKINLKNRYASLSLTPDIILNNQTVMKKQPEFALGLKLSLSF